MYHHLNHLRSLLAAIITISWASLQAFAQCDRLETVKLIGGGLEDDAYGQAVALHDGIAVVGAPGSDLAAPSGGAIYVYAFDGRDWIEQTILTASDAIEGPNLGNSVSIDGDVIVAGARNADTEIALGAGAAYVFRFDGEKWQEEAKLFAADGAYHDFFGRSVSVSGNAIVVGADGDDDNGTYSGSAYIFRFDGEKWQQEVKLTHPDGDSNDNFGFSTSISNDVVAVGAYGDDSPFECMWDNGFGSTFVYRFDGVQWVQEAKLIQNDDMCSAWFGYALSVSDDLLVVGAPLIATDLLPGGAAYAYRFDGTEWIEIATLDPFDVDEWDNLGTSVSVKDNVAVIGSDFGNYGCFFSELFGAGTAYIFKFDENGCLGQTRLGTSDPAHIARFGRSVGVDNGMAIVGRFKDENVESGTGSVYIFDDLGPDEGCNCDEVILYVDDDAAPGGDGLSWNTALTDLQVAIVAASRFTEIRVAQGVYTPDSGPCNVAGDRLAKFDVSRVGIVRGGYAGVGSTEPDDRDTKRYKTILSGDLNGDDGPDFSKNSDNSHNVLFLDHFIHEAVLDGLVFTAGNAIDAPVSKFGAGARVLSAATFIDCVFEGNIAEYGAGLVFYNNGEARSLILERCVFRGNNAIDKGGAIYHNISIEKGAASSLVAKDCIFMDNEAVEGGAIFVNPFIIFPDVDITFLNCLFAGNAAYLRGGAIYNFGYAGATIDSKLLNCTFADNVAGDTGGAIYNGSFAGNVDMLAFNSVFWNNAPDQIFSENTFSITVEINYSNIEGGWDGEGDSNLDTNPMFVDPGNDNYRISKGSPCIDSADNTAVLNDITTDLDGNPRFVDDPKTKDTGNGDPPIVDMGAYEYQGLNTCPWDIDGDDNVSIADLTALLDAWGPNPGHPADINGDGSVGVSDLLELLANWGSCS